MEDEEAEIDAIFRKLAEDKNNDVNQLLYRARPGGQRSHLYSAPVSLVSESVTAPAEFTRPSEALRLFEVQTLMRWAKVPVDRIKTLQESESVKANEVLADAMLCLPLEKRRIVTPYNILSHHEMGGCFERLLDLEAFQVPSGGQFLLCTMLNRRIDADHILACNYVFVLVDGGTRAYVGDSIHDRGGQQSEVVRVPVQSFAILSEKTRLVNFFYEFLPWHVRVPLPEKQYK